MNKLEMETRDISQEHISKIRELFPSVVSEIKVGDKIRLAIDFDALKQELSEELISERKERYQMTWPDKSKAILLSNSKISETLRPIKEKSKNFETTKNLYIEGNNLESLKLIREAYLGQIKMIYIDPPYNTGTNLIYKNDFTSAKAEYVEQSGQIDENGLIMTKNPESNGRFHTDWLNMIYPALRVSRDLLRKDGYIAIAIDDNEVHNLTKICDEIFDEYNYVGTIVTRCNPQGRGKLNIDPCHEYHLVYARDITMLENLKIKKEVNGSNYGYLMRSGTNSRKNERPYRFYPMLVKNEKVSTISKEEYAKIYNKISGFDEEWILELKNKYEKLGYKYILPISKDGEEKVWQREFSRVSKECETYIYENGQIKVPGEDTRTPVSLWTEEKYSNVSNGTNRLKKMFNDKCRFDFSKSIYTVKDLISLSTEEDDIILDFFPGSGTTAEAVMRLNAEDGGNRRFILTQLPEKCEETTEAYKFGYRTICDVGEERIRRAGELLVKEYGNVGDVGFRVLKLDTSNMNDVYYNPSKMSQTLLDSTIDNIKADRTGLDLLFQVMIELGIDLSSKIVEENFGGKICYKVNDNDIIACFDEDLSNDVITEIAKLQPVYAIFKNKSFSSDSVGINNEQIFKTYSPTTDIKVL